MKLKQYIDEIDVGSLSESEAREYIDFLLFEIEAIMGEIRRYTRISNAMDETPLMHEIAGTKIREGWRKIKFIQESIDYLNTKYGM